MQIIDNIKKDIINIVNNSIVKESVVDKLKSNGYDVNYVWIKGSGDIGNVYVMQKEIRIQVSEGILHGRYHKAFCVIIKK